MEGMIAVIDCVELGRQEYSRLLIDLKVFKEVFNLMLIQLL